MIAPTTNESSTAPNQWRSLEELAGSDSFNDWLRVEFPSVQWENLDGISRRRFVQVAAASLALAGVAGCSPYPPEDVVPAVRGEQAFTPSRPEYFATTLRSGPHMLGVLVENHMGRPTKIEGNPDHPASLGGTDALTQAQILTLYDPARSQAVQHRERISTWERFQKALGDRLDALQQTGGKGLRLLTSSIDSPTMRAQLATMFEKFPKARWHIHQPIDEAHQQRVMQVLFGQDLSPLYRVDRARVIVALDSDFLNNEPGSVRYARQFASRRDSARHRSDRTNRLYAAEPCPTITGSKADHRLAVPHSEIVGIALALAVRMNAWQADSRIESHISNAAIRWVDLIVRDLEQHRSEAIVIAGRSQPPAVHTLAWLINAQLGVLGRTVDFYPPPDALRPDSLQVLVDAMAAGSVDTLLMIDVNPAYDAPVDLAFEKQLGRVPFSAHLGLYRDETARLSTWHVPMTHPLETWSDAETFDGIRSPVQPLIRPLYNGASPHEMLSLVNAQIEQNSREIVLAHWRRARGESGFDTWWRGVLRTGVIDTRPPLTDIPQPKANRASELIRAVSEKSGGDSIELRFAPHHSLWDGSFASNAWMQELPDPVSKLCWGSAALIAPATAERLGLAQEQVVQIQVGEQTLEAPIWNLPGHATDSITLPLGGGRRMPGTLASDVGFSAYTVRTLEGLWSSAAVVRPTNKRVQLTCTQHHHAMEGRDLVRVVDAGSEHNGGQDLHDGSLIVPLSLYPQRPMTGQQWGMVIDQARCTGCNACVIACQAENNIPPVGAQEVRRGRVMHWIRVDRYFEGPADDPAIHHQPVLCMHCENAPCEVVCPVAATSHSDDGLNEMTYNRCVGTRYCSNNCPYKVRRFNFFNYTVDQPSLNMQRNPDVTVRSRGVMEKCTYCVQRIRTAEITARKENRPIADGDVLTACQQVCPAEAIVFGNINDPQSRIAAARTKPGHYGLLTELNTRPRTTYLPAFVNRHPNVGPS